METGFIVEGYRFYSSEEAKRASREVARIKAINEKVDRSNMAALKAVYVKAVDQNVFETQVGIEYLRNLQTLLLAKGVLTNEEKPLPVRYSKILWETEAKHIKEECDVYAAKEMEEVQKQLREERRNRKKAEAGGRVKNLVIGGMGLLVILMFVIAYTGKSENILNYKRNIINQYAQWEEELNERESFIRQKEAALSIDTEP